MTKVGMLVLVVVAVWLAPVADARDWSSGPLVQVQGDASKKRAGPPVPRGERARPPRHDKQGHQGQGRLTQEERRELNRDLDRANREIYRRR